MAEKKSDGKKTAPETVVIYNSHTNRKMQVDAVLWKKHLCKVPHLKRVKE